MVGLRPWQREARYRNLWVTAGDRREEMPFRPKEQSSRTADPLDEVVLPRIAYFTRHPLSRSNSISCHLWQSQPDRLGCGIHVFDSARPNEPPTTIFGEAPRSEGFVWITHEFPEIGDHSEQWSYRDPFPLSDSVFLVAYGGGGTRRFRIYLLDVNDNKRLLIEDSSMGCYNPLALRPTAKPAVIASQTETAQEPYGECYLVDAYQGLTGIEREQAKSIRVMEQMRKTEDLVSRAYDQSPVMSYGTYYAKRT